MAIELPKLPVPPQPSVRRYDDSGRPTPALVIYETELQQFLKAVKAAIEGL